MKVVKRSAEVAGRAPSTASMQTRTNLVGATPRPIPRPDDNSRRKWHADEAVVTRPLTGPSKPAVSLDHREFAGPCARSSSAEKITRPGEAPR